MCVNIYTYDTYVHKNIYTYAVVQHWSGSSGFMALELPRRNTPHPRSEKPQGDGKHWERASEGRQTKTTITAK